MKKNLSLTLVIFILISTITGCKNNNPLDPKNPVTITLWHNYGGQMKETMDEMIDTFNNTIGEEKGIIINVTSISGSSTLHEKLIMAAKGDPGATELPDITTAYPKTASIMANENLLLDIGTQFSEKELAKYVPRFVEEGRFTDDKLFVFPIAKSTEVLFVNKTFFNEFSKETGVTLDSLKTFEGIAKASTDYYEWTDQKTPEIANDGKAFFTPDSIFNLSQIGFKQLGENFIENEKLNLSSNSFLKIWDFYYSSAVRGGVAIFDGYGSDLMKTGEVICTIGSTAGVLFFSPIVTYPDNTTVDVEYEIMPYPVFDGGEKVAMQRGSGMCVIKSTAQKEYAASVFLKWFTEPTQNLKFVSSTGYLPVTQKAFDEINENEIANVKDLKIKQLLSTCVLMQKEYDFYIPPVFDNFDTLGKDFEESLKGVSTKSKEEFLALLSTKDAESAFSDVSKGDLEAFKK